MSDATLKKIDLLLKARQKAKVDCDFDEVERLTRAIEEAKNGEARDA